MMILQGELGMPGMPGKQGVKVVHFYCSLYLSPSAFTHDPQPFIKSYPFFPEPCMLFQKHSFAKMLLRDLNLICYDFK